MNGGQLFPEPLICPFAYFTDETYKCGCSGQQNLILKQPRSGKIKHQTGAFIAEPCTGVQQTFQAERPRKITKFMIAVIFLYLRGMFPASGITLGIAGEDFRTAYIKLYGDKC